MFWWNTSPPSSGLKNKRSKEPVWKQVAYFVSCLAYSLTLKMEMTCSSKTLVDFQWTTHVISLKTELYITAVRIWDPLRDNLLRYGLICDTVGFGVSEECAGLILGTLILFCQLHGITSQKCWYLSTKWQDVTPEDRIIWEPHISQLLY
jgi:hypothetical protein